MSFLPFIGGLAGSMAAGSGMGPEDALFGLLGSKLMHSGSGQDAAGPLGGLVNAATQGAAPQMPQQAAGMFGLKGTGRDIIGALADAFLVQGGADPIYRQSREKEAMSQALQGYADDPMAAIDRATRLNPAYGQKLRESYAEQELKRQKEAREYRKDNIDIMNEARKVAGAMYYGTNPDTFKAADTKVRQFFKSRGIDPEAMGLPNDYSGVEGYVNSVIDPYRLRSQASTDAYRAQQLEDADYRNETARINAGISQQRADETKTNNEFNRRDKTIRTVIAQQNASKKPSSETTKIGKIKASKVPSSARLGRKDGKRVAQINGKIYYVED